MITNRFNSFHSGIYKRNFRDTIKCNDTLTSNAATRCNQESAVSKVCQQSSLGLHPAVHRHAALGGTTHSEILCGETFCAQHTLMLGMRGVKLQNTGGTETIEDVLGLQLDICSTDPCNSQI